MVFKIFIGICSFLALISTPFPLYATKKRAQSILVQSPSKKSTSRLFQDAHKKSDPFQQKLEKGRPVILKDPSAEIFKKIASTKLTQDFRYFKIEVAHLTHTDENGTRVIFYMQKKYITIEGQRVPFNAMSEPGCPNGSVKIMIEPYCYKGKTPQELLDIKCK